MSYEDMRRSMTNQNDMAVALARHVIATEAKGKNLVLSPVSIRVVLGMMAAGSKGPAREQVLGFLKSESIEQDKSLVSQLVKTILADGGPHLAFANGIWLDQSLTLKPKFDDVVKTYYKADLSLVDFKTKAAEVVRAVNKWAENQTKGLIRDIISLGSVNPATRLILANALYFKGDWEQKFDESKTKRHEFFLPNGTSVRVPFMTSRKRQIIKAYDGFKVLGLRYQQGRELRRGFSMYMFLPDARDGLPGLLRKAGSTPDFIDRHVPREDVVVRDFRIPKFKFEFGFEACNVLKGMGLVLPELTEVGRQNMGKEPLYVSSILHKSCIEVNEGGTEAAAVTVSMACGRCAPPRRAVKEVDFVADHPFLFVVKEDFSGLILFIGQVVNPLDD